MLCNCNGDKGITVIDEDDLPETELPVEKPTSVTDVEGNIYKVVTIGNQVWMAENLMVKKYPNNKQIPQIENGGSWKNLNDNNTDDAYYYSSNGNAKNGVNYSYSAAIADNWTMDNAAQQGICPNGWHLPTDNDWKELEEFLGVSNIDLDKEGFRGYYAGLKLKASTFWSVDRNGTNEYGFSALLTSDLPLSYNGVFSLSEPAGTHWWTATESNGEFAYYRSLRIDENGINRGKQHKSQGYCIRCIMNKK